MLREAPEGTFDTALLAGGWNLLGQDSLPIITECQKRGIAVHNAGVFATGFLVGGESYLYDTPPPEITAARAGWEALAARHGCSLPAVALRFASLPAIIEHGAPRPSFAVWKVAKTKRFLGWAAVLLGVKSPEEVELNVGTIEQAAAVPDQLWADAKAEGLLPADLPVPGAGAGAKL